MVEHIIRNDGVRSSNLLTGTIPFGLVADEFEIAVGDKFSFVETDEQQRATGNAHLDGSRYHRTVVVNQLECEARQKDIDARAQTWLDRRIVA